MGARESKAAHDSTGDANAPEDYYQLLEVEETATQDEIRVGALRSFTYPKYRLSFRDQRSFRRLALIHHPDKNRGNTEEATQKFAAIQQAYEVCRCCQVYTTYHWITLLIQVLSDEQVSFWVH